MAYTLVNIVEITNISDQSIPVNIKKLVGSPFFTSYGAINLVSKNKIMVEKSRLDMTQLRSMAKSHVLHLEEMRRSADIIASQSGSSGA